MWSPSIRGSVLHWLSVPVTGWFCCHVHVCLHRVGSFWHCVWDYSCHSIPFSGFSKSISKSMLTPGVYTHISKDFWCMQIEAKIWMLTCITVGQRWGSMPFTASVLWREPSRRVSARPGPQEWRYCPSYWGTHTTTRCHSACLCTFSTTPIRSTRMEIE